VKRFGGEALTMRVLLLSWTGDCERLVAVASKLTITKKSMEEVWESMSEEEVEKWIEETVKRGHLSTWEHCVYTFYVSGVSRVLTHQLVRHRIASYTQHSQRYRAAEGKFVTPPAIMKSEKMRESYEEAVKKSLRAYEELVAMGAPYEEARYALPQAIETKILVTMNARELMHFFSLRTCSRAQAEIRALAWRMLEKVREVHPRLWKWAGPRCIQTENLIRKEPLPLDAVLASGQSVRMISERCPEGVPGDRIPSCILQSYAARSEV